MTELKKIFDDWLENTPDTEEEKQALKQIKKHLGDKFSEEDEECLISAIFQYATQCQWSSFLGGFRKASLIWQEITLWRLDAEKYLHNLRIMKPLDIINDLQEIEIPAEYELTTEDIETIKRGSSHPVELVRNSFLYGYIQGRQAKSAELKRHINRL